jgi:hypothetical protein
MKNLKFFVVIIFISLWSPLTLATFTISPTAIHFKKDETVASLSVRSHLDEKRHFQLELIKLDEHGNKQRNNKDLLITPIMFKILPGKSQLIRVSRHNENKTGKYELSIKVLPHGEPEANSIRFVTEFIVKIHMHSADEEDDRGNKADDGRENSKDDKVKKSSSEQENYKTAIPSMPAIHLGSEKIGDKTAIILSLPISVSNVQ